MNTTTSPRFQLPNADRVGVAASVLCAIHCGLAPVLLLALPAFGKIWAHPASHALVAILIVPLAILSIRKGYQKHGRRWVVMFAGIGISSVLIGAVLPAFTSKSVTPVSSQENLVATGSEDECEACESCETCEASATTTTTVGCVDNCCPSAQISETGEVSLHIPPAAIVTTLGGVFLIIAHIGNLKGHHLCCPTKAH